MKIALGLGLTEEAVHFAAQLGVKYAVWGMQEFQTRGRSWVELEVLLQARDFFAGAGLELRVLEGFPHSFYHQAMFGLPGREEEIDHVCTSILNMGRAGIPVLSYQRGARFRLSAWLYERHAPGD
ncbi:MAG: mannonate dehydratase [Candidatus Latescibacteria bacterium]|nr:mannonate dehydratase [Candidatus Latescibacterota bacterium]